jgi:polyisoprenyl-teichoic acid--peptidoglycan teichoic acid transferase
MAGRPRVGHAVLRGWGILIGTIALLGLLWYVARGAVLVLFTDPRVLHGVSLLSYLLAAGYAVLLGHTWRLGDPGNLPRRARPAVALLTVALVAGTAVPLIGLGRRASAAADLLADVFTGGQTSAAVAGRYNVLLLGGDAGPDRIGTRPDSITLASIDATTGSTVLFSLPRNLENVPFAPDGAAARALPNGFSCGDGCLLNGIYAWGAEHRHLFPAAADPGAEAMKQAVEGITGLTVNYYVLIDLRGFADLVDALGGIEIMVGAAVPIGGGTSPVSGYIRPGRQRLDGYHALWFARSRTGASDYARMARQRCVLDAMRHQLDPAAVVQNFQAIAAAGTQVVSTDLPPAQLPGFIDLAGRAKDAKVHSVQFVPPLIDPAYPDYPRIRQLVGTALNPAEPGAGTAGTGTAAGSTPSAPSAPATTSAAGTASGSGSGSGAGSGTGAADAPVVEDVSAVCSAV